MTQSERKRLMPQISKAMALVNDVIQALGDETPAGTKAAVEKCRELSALLVEVENVIGCHTPTSLFED